MSAQLSDSHKVAGYKQTIRAIRQGRAIKVFIAVDADPTICEAVKKAAELAGIMTKETTMFELGKACGIDVPTAAAACVILKVN
jgi:large subunit ribosomal protein L7A